MLLLVYQILYFLSDALEQVQGLFREVLGWRLVLLHGLQVDNRGLGLGLLLVNDSFELVELGIYLADDLSL